MVWDLRWEKWEAVIECARKDDKWRSDPPRGLRKRESEGRV